MKTRLLRSSVSMGRMLLAVAMAAALAAGTARPVVAATQIDIVGPPGSGAFGTTVTVLPNGNIVVTDPHYDAGATPDVGAVYLYNGATGALISTLTGSTVGDYVGGRYHSVGPWYAYIGGVRVLSNGNYLVLSPEWDNGPAWDAGAVTWGSSTTGVSGVVSAANSLVGSTADDQVGRIFDTEMLLSNGNYVVRSPYWDNGATADVGAVTWGNGTTGVSGPVSAAKSLVGSAAGDQIGYNAVPLINGNYVVSSPFWNNGAGAVTWGNGMTGIAGPVSAANSLVGSTAGDGVGGWGGDVMPLSNGNYVVISAIWDRGAIVNAGAVTWGSGAAGVSGLVSAANSLVGSTDDDLVGFVTALSNGNYVVASQYWDNGAIVDAGAATWGSGASGVKGVMSAANSLVGSTDYDQVGSSSVTALNNGNYVVNSSDWNYGAGAVTWGNGMTGIAGPVSAANSLVGSTASDYVGSYGTTTALSNGNYVVASDDWDNGAVVDAGAVTWGNGSAGTSGPVSAANSLVGSTAGDLHWAGVMPLSNGNYVVVSGGWDNGAVVDAGAVTWGNGTTGTSGVVSEANSLVGSTPYDAVGYGYFGEGVTALSNGSYVVGSPDWDNDAIVDAGAVTWGDGMSGVSGVVSATNSLVGSTDDDRVGGVQALSNGNYVVASGRWDNGAVVDAGAVTWGSGMTGVSGPVSAANSLVGSTDDDRVGLVQALSNGNYVVASGVWDNGAVVDAGAVIWGNGMTGTSSVVSAANSLAGSTSGDEVGYSYFGEGVTALSNSSYVVYSELWDNGAVVDAGAVTWGDRIGGTAGPITAENSVRGTAENGGEWIRWAYDGVHRQLVVGRPADNIVTLFRPALVNPVFLPVVLKNAP